MTLPGLFLAGAGFIAISAFILQEISGAAALDIHLHDTYFVLAHLHVMLLAALVFGLLAAVYFLYPKCFNRRLHHRAGLVHFWITFPGTLLIFWPVRYEGIAGTPRRYYDYEASHALLQFAQLNTRIFIAVVLVFLAQLVFAGNLLLSLRTRRA